MQIEDFRDYPAIRKLGQSLWGESSSVHGAAIMIGAGFSRCAALCGDQHRTMPLWGDLARLIACELERGAEEDHDPLRIAEEYVAFFGRRRLIELAHSEICDAAWSPGPLHDQLLQLPWRDILTTNWDTLLERSSRSRLEPKYSVVNHQTELAVARPPRITKLHGTISVTPDLIFTQEDYRTYPQRFAMFVNFARQVFIENELCLLGFSGTDPNFLQWAGWVRDRLDNQARRIFLVGNHNFTESNRKYLESINVIPIDLYPLVSQIPDTNKQHEMATARFLSELHSLKPKPPSEWQISTHTQSNLVLRKRAPGKVVGAENQRQDQSPEKICQALKKDRESFPKWVLCPQQQFHGLLDQLFTCSRILRDIEGTGDALELKLLLETLWRLEMTFQPAPLDLADRLLDVLSKPIKDTLNGRDIADGLLITLRGIYPCITEDSLKLSKRLIEAIEPYCRLYPEIADERSFLQAAIARNRLEFEEMKTYASSIIGARSDLLIKKSILLAELGEFESSEKIFARAYDLLARDYRDDRSSLYISDRAAWASILAKGISYNPVSKRKFQEIEYGSDNNCDPERHLQHLRDRIQTEYEADVKQNRVDPLFKPGSYRKGSDGKRLSNGNRSFQAVLPWASIAQ